MNRLTPAEDFDFEKVIEKASFGKFLRLSWNHGYHEHQELSFKGEVMGKVWGDGMSSIADGRPCVIIDIIASLHSPLRREPFEWLPEPPVHSPFELWDDYQTAKSCGEKRQQQQPAAVSALDIIPRFLKSPPMSLSLCADDSTSTVSEWKVWYLSPFATGKQPFSTYRTRGRPIALSQGSVELSMKVLHHGWPMGISNQFIQKT